MAAIVHRCACEHLADHHVKLPKGDTAPCSMGRCDCADVDPGPPEVIPTWVTTRPIGAAVLDPVLLEPGSTPAMMPTLCDCEDCWTFHGTADTVGQVA